MRNTYDIFEKIQKIALSFTLLCISLAILALIWVLVDPFSIKLVAVLIASIILFVFSLFIKVITDIPKAIVKKFDVIKNKIATGEISTVQNFNTELSSFLVNYFNYITFDVEYAAVKVKEHPVVFSQKIENDDLNNALTKITEKTVEENKTISLGKFKINNENHKAYLIPIHFGNQWLGYFVVFTKSSLNRIYLDFLSNFEDNFIDDQLIHVLRNHNN